MARDVSTSPKNATAVVTINIVRNNFAPEFSSQTYNASARDLDPYGKSVLNVTAADADRLNQYSANVRIYVHFWIVLNTWLNEEMLKLFYFFIFSDAKCIGELFLAIWRIDIQQVFPNHTYRKPESDSASSLRNKYNFIAGMCGFFFCFLFYYWGGGLLYISLLVSLDEIGIFYWRAGEGGGGLLYISILVCK